MPKDDWVFVAHIWDMSQKALTLVAGKNKEAYEQDEVLRLALTRLIEVIGEAANRVSEEFRAAHPEMPWFEMIGMRHRIVHDYMNVDEDVIWAVVQKDLPALAEILQKIIPPEMLE